jgi:ketosteroid isomerase-like protein
VLRKQPEAVRQAIAARPHSRRSLDQRLAIRFPPLQSLLARLVWKLPPTSVLRRKMVAYAARVLFESFNRGDYEAAFALYHPLGETSFPPQLASVGFESNTRGRAERVLAQRRWNAEWGEFRNEPQEVIDLGDRVLLLVHLRGIGLSSGAPFDTEAAYLLAMSDGRATREQMFLDHREALEAAGLAEHPLAEPGLTRRRSS